jgi:hypothetical protein
MKIWKLTPIELDDPHWKRSTHKETVVVRANDQDDARTVCNIAFGIAMTRQRGQTGLSNPWMQTSLARCEEMKSGDWDGRGLTEVLSPELYDDNLADCIATLGT